MRYFKLCLCLVSFAAVMSFSLYKPKPVLYIIGDSTVKNGDGKNNNLLQGWGSFVDAYFDTTKISIRNHAIGGRSSRTFITEGRWDKILATLKKGDYVLIQFGHNDSGPLDDTARARGTIKGTGEDSIVTFNPIRKRAETVHSYGWYMRKYVQEAKAKGATPIICSPIPRNDWKNGKVDRSNESYTLWSRQVAEANNAYFIDLHNRIADEYDNILGEEKVRAFFPKEHTHTNKAGAELNARIVVKGIQELEKCKLKKFLL
jgi:lysophospholipase L1-like esterase